MKKIPHLKRTPEDIEYYNFILVGAACLESQMFTETRLEA